MSEADLEARIAQLERKVAALAAPKVIVLRDVTLAQAKREILAFALGRGDDPVYASDVEEELRISYEVARDALRELASEGLMRRGGS